MDDCLPAGTDVEELLAKGGLAEWMLVWRTYEYRRSWLDLIAKVGEGDPSSATFARNLESWAPVTALQALEASRLLVGRLTGRRWAVMRDAREAGDSWAEIGEALEISRQAAQQFYTQTIELQERHLGELHDTARARAVMDEAG